MAAIKLKFVVEELSNVLLEFDQIKVYRSTAGEAGPYSEITVPATRIDMVAGTTLYEYIDGTGDTSYWYKFSYFNSSTLAEGSQSEAISGEDSGGLYCSVQDLRDEGVTTTVLSDARALAKIRQWSGALERWTGRWFEPRLLEFRIDGEGATAQRVPHPIIQVDEIAVVSELGSGYTEDEVDLADVIVYNRHLTMGIERPDDRANPRLEVARLDDSWRNTKVSSTLWAGLFRWPSGRQNIRLRGYFGYTDLGATDSPGETLIGSQIPLSQGETPELIKIATLMLVVRDQAQLGDLDGREDWTKRWRLLSEKTREQSYTLQPLQTEGAGAMGGAWTGDPVIDGIIATYKAPSTRTTFAEAV